MYKHNIRLKKAREYYYEHKDRVKERYLEKREENLKYMEIYNKLYYAVRRETILEIRTNRSDQKSSRRNNTEIKSNIHDIDFTIYFDD